MTLLEQLLKRRADLDAERAELLTRRSQDSMDRIINAISVEKLSAQISELSLVIGLIEKR